MVLKCWRARISVGAISAACRPASITAAAASSATTVLPEPTSPCSMRSMRSRLAEIVDDDIDARDAATASANRAGRRRSSCAMRPSPALGASRPALADARAAAPARAGRRAIRQRRAASRPGFRARCRSGSCGRCSVCNASAKAGKPLRVEPGRDPAIPATSGSLSSAPSIALRTCIAIKSFGQRIDRLDHRQGREALFVDHAIGMHHLQHAVVERGRARHVARLADRKQLLQIILARAGNRSGPGRRSRRWHRSGRARADGWAAPGDGGRSSTFTVTTWPGTTSRSFGCARRSTAPVGMWNSRSTSARHVLAPEQAAKQLLDLRPDAGQRRDRGKEGVEEDGPHGQ